MYKKLSVFLILLAGCQGAQNSLSERAPESCPQIPLFTSEYPSWATFVSASDLGLIDGRPGWIGPIEKKYGIDLDVRNRTYDACLTEFGSVGGAICITNTDLPGIYKNRPSTAVLPTSTSAGADACLIVGIDGITQLKTVEVFGLENSVSDFAFTRILEELGQNPKDYKFRNRDPEATATSLQSGSIQAGMTWNPYVILTLQNQAKAKPLFDTKTITGEVIDMVAFDNVTLEAPHGTNAVLCVMETYYKVCGALKDTSSDKAYLSLKERFAPSLTVDQMRSICELGKTEGEGYKTHFYSTPEEGIQIFQQKHLSPIMEKVMKWAKERQIVEGDLAFYNRETLQKTSLDANHPPVVVFDESFMVQFKDSSK